MPVPEHPGLAPQASEGTRWTFFPFLYRKRRACGQHETPTRLVINTEEVSTYLEMDLGYSCEYSFTLIWFLAFIVITRHSIGMLISHAWGASEEQLPTQSANALHLAQNTHLFLIIVFSASCY